MKAIVISLVKPFKALFVFLFELEARISRFWVSSVHHRLFLAQWGLPPSPEFFDHHIDLYYQWIKLGSPFWLERGVFGSLCLKEGGTVLELGCGDGFNSKNFYSNRVNHIIACDFDPSAIATAKRKNQAKNVDFFLADIRTAMPTGKFDNIIWDASIEHFTPEEIESIMKNIKSRLTEQGVMSGYTLVERQDGAKHLHQHEYEFKDMADLRRFLTPYFRHVTVFETIYPSRHNLYFWASDSVIPFSSEWKHWLTV
jgi:SAM-dependent methyltransferase